MSTRAVSATATPLLIAFAFAATSHAQSDVDVDAGIPDVSTDVGAGAPVVVDAGPATSSQSAPAAPAAPSEAGTASSEAGAASSEAGAASSEAGTASSEAGTSSSEAGTSSSTPELTPEELEAIRKATAADAQPQGALTNAGAPDLSKVNVGALASPNAGGAGAGGASGGGTALVDIAFILDVAGAWFSVDDPRQLGEHDPQRSGFTLQQLEMSLGASVDPFLRFDGNVVFSTEGVDLEEAYATTLSLPWNLQARAGQFLTRFGRINATHPHAWHFVDQSLVIGKFFGPEGNRGIGGELSWLAPLPWFTEGIVSVTNASDGCCMRSYFGDDDIGIKSPLDLAVTGALKQFFPINDDLAVMVGVSAQTGPNATGNLNRSEIYGADLVVRYRPVDADTRWSLSWETEALLRARQVPFDNLVDAGGYTQLVWQVDPTWETAARYELVTGVDGDPLDPDWSSSRHRGTASLTYYPSHFSRLRAQTSMDFFEPFDAPVFAVMLSLEIIVGAHGAHSY